MKPKLYVMVGLSASGKSTVAKEIKDDFLKKNEDCIIVSSDSIRGEICKGGVTDQTQNGKVFYIFHKRIAEGLRTGKNVIADATNINKWTRANILKAVEDIDCEKIAYVLDKPEDDCVRDNIGREYAVPEQTIHKQKRKFIYPKEDEGFDELIVVKVKEAG